jgi:hypothetical protein
MDLFRSPTLHTTHRQMLVCANSFFCCSGLEFFEVWSFIVVEILRFFRKHCHQTLLINTSTEFNNAYLPAAVHGDGNCAA